MLIVKFATRDAKITWFINENWVMVISFLLTMAAGIAYRRIKNPNKKIKMANPKGGAFIDNCIEPDSVYELVDPATEITLRKMLNLPLEAGPIIISVPLLILSYVVSRQPFKQMSFWGLSIFVHQARSVAIKAGIGVACGSAFFIIPAGFLNLASRIIGSATIMGFAMNFNGFDCNSFVSRLPMERVSEEKTIAFLDTPRENTPKVFIKGSDNTEIYVISSNDNDSCYSDYQSVELDKLTTPPVTTEPKTLIHRTCEKKYVPLKKRTKTLADLKKEDSTENRKQAAPYIERYKNRRKSIMNERVE